MERPKSPSSEVGSRWHAHPFLSALVRAAALLIPAVVAFAFSLVASRMFPPPHSVGGRVGWWLALGTLALIVLIAVQRVARRLLPLAALLNLSLLFPDQAPARYKLARRVGSPNELKRMVDDARAASADGAEALAPQTVLELVAALSVHDRATRGHSERVRIFTDMIADELKLPEADQERLRWAALLHDVGKLNVSPSLLKKPGAPTAGEWAELKRHPEDGRRLVASIAPWLGPWALAVDHHHERFDGAGYPHQLRGQQISLAGRIVAVADSYETMTAARPYKRPLSPKAARNELVACSGAQFDPAVVRAFLNVSLGRLWRTIGISAVISQIPLLPQISSGLSLAGAQAGPIASSSAASLFLVTGASIAGPSPPSAAANPQVVSQSLGSAWKTPGHNAAARTHRSNHGTAIRPGPLPRTDPAPPGPKGPTPPGPPNPPVPPASKRPTPPSKPGPPAPKQPATAPPGKTHGGPPTPPARPRH
ncbi:MAG TPA: HD-GYP domain-containing protein [Candidatus Dormibacteraeota bacterium]